MPRLPAFALITGLTLAAVACGGGSNGRTPTPAATPTTAQVVCAPAVLVTPGAPREAAGPLPAVTAQPTTTADGLQIIDVAVGTGVEAKAGDCVIVNYSGWLADGTSFDNSSLHGGPYRTPLDQVIVGWREGVPGMKVGGTRRLIIPPELGYGADGIPGTIPPNATLTFDIELLSIP